MTELWLAYFKDKTPIVTTLRGTQKSCQRAARQVLGGTDWRHLKWSTLKSNEGVRCNRVRIDVVGDEVHS